MLNSAMTDFERDIAAEAKARRERLGMAQSKPMLVVIPKEAAPVYVAAPTCYRPYSNRWREILAGVADRHGVTQKEILGPYRVRHLVQARAELCWLLRQHTTMSWPQIAAKMNRDHSTLLHLARKYGQRVEARIA